MTVEYVGRYRQSALPTPARRGSSCDSLPHLQKCPGGWFHGASRGRCPYRFSLCFVLAYYSTLVIVCKDNDSFSLHQSFCWKMISGTVPVITAAVAIVKDGWKKSFPDNCKIITKWIRIKTILTQKEYKHKSLKN